MLQRLKVDSYLTFFEQHKNMEMLPRREEPDPTNSATSRKT